MDLVEVDVVEPEPLERGVDRREDVLAREAAAVLAGHRLAVHLRRDDVLLAHPEELAQQAPGDDLALAAVVDVGGVEEDDAALDGAPDDRLGRRLVERPLAALVLPKLIIPRHTRETRRPVLPEVHVRPSSSRYRPEALVRTVGATSTYDCFTSAALILGVGAD